MNDAEATVEFAISNGLIAIWPLIRCPVGQEHVIFEAVKRSIFGDGAIRWAVKEYLAELEAREKP